MINIPTLVIVLAITVAFCIPFIISHRKKRSQQQVILSSFMEKAGELQLNISSLDIWRRSYAIGIDENQSRLLYIKFGQGAMVKSVDLTSVTRVSISKEEREIESGTTKEKVIDRLLLLLDFHSSSPVPLEFYNSDENMEMMGEPVLIKKWQDLVKTSLEQIKLKRKVSQR